MPTINPAHSSAARRQRIIRACLLIGLLVLGTLVLSGCSSPSDASVCGTNAAKCVSPGGVIHNPSDGAPWYMQWFYDGINAMLGFICNQSVGIGINLFWKIFSSQATLDFVKADDKRIGAVNAVETIVAGVAYALIPAVLIWQIFRHYGINTLLEATRDGLFTIGLKVLGAALCILNLPAIMTFGFGLSNAVFVAIVGDTSKFHDLAAATLVSISNNTGAIHDPGLLVILVIICVILGLVWLLLGIVFLIRTVLVFIMYGLAPLAFLAATMDEFKAWFEAWFEEVMNLIIAPIPVAICIRLVVEFSDVTQLQKTDATQFDVFGDSILQLIYILFFMTIGVVLMGKIGGKVSGAMFKIAAHAFKQAVRAGMHAATGGGSAGAESLTGASAGASASVNITFDRDTLQNMVGGGSGGGSSDTGSSPSGESAGGAPAGGGWPSGGSYGGGGGGSVQGGDVTRGLRSFNETMQDFAYSASARSGSYSSGGRGGSGMAVAEAEIATASAPPARYSGSSWQASEPTPAMRESAAPPEPSYATMRESAPPATEYVPRQTTEYVTGAVADPFGSRNAERLNRREDD